MINGAYIILGIIAVLATFVVVKEKKEKRADTKTPFILTIITMVIVSIVAITKYGFSKYLLWSIPFVYVAFICSYSGIILSAKNKNPPLLLEGAKQSKKRIVISGILVGIIYVCLLQVPSLYQISNNPELIS